MSDRNLVTFGNLKHYNDKLNENLEIRFHGKADDPHHHDLAEMGTDINHLPTKQSDINRLSAFRRCYINDSATGNVPLDSTHYDMFYLQLTGRVTLEIKNENTDPAEEKTDNTYARHIKVIIKNPSRGVDWSFIGNISSEQPELLWMNGTEYTPTTGDNSVDVFDLFTPDGVVWFGNFMKSWTL